MRKAKQQEKQPQGKETDRLGVSLQVPAHGAEVDLRFEVRTARTSIGWIG